jgi:hypothetical protein
MRRTTADIRQSLTRHGYVAKGPVDPVDSVVRNLIRHERDLQHDRLPRCLMYLFEYLEIAEMEGES